jgi:ElaB/YqjD/DUF883 family membrane-anchored ribosome-binding protein
MEPANSVELRVALFSWGVMMGTSKADLAASKDEVVSSFKGLIAGAEDLLRTTANSSGDSVDRARKNFRVYLDNARETLHDVEDKALKTYKDASETTDVYVRSNPWQAVGIAVAAGVLVGIFAGTRRLD